MTFLVPSNFGIGVLSIHFLLLFYGIVVLIPKWPSTFIRSIRLLIMIAVPIIGSGYFILDEWAKEESYESN